jgi:REP element-mobilizing transposase RayT
MPRLPRIYIEGALYYITSQGNQNRDLFNGEKDYESYLELLAKYKKEYGFKLFAFVLLPKHLHLLVELKNNVAISAIMHDLNSLYTKAFNSRYQRKGHLFQGRFKSILLEKKEYLVRLTRYMHLNPKRANMAIELKDYPFSSYQLYIGNQATKEAVKELRFPNIHSEIEEVFSSFNESDKQKAYQDFVVAGSERDSFEIARLLHRKAFVGSREFMETVKEKMKSAAVEEDKARAQSRPYKLFIILGAIAITILGATTLYFYANSIETRKRFDLFMYDFSRNLVFTTSQTKKEVVNTLDNSKWDIMLTHGSSGDQKSDVLVFENIKFSSSNLLGLGFPSSNYSITANNDGSNVWETMQTKDDGSTATWYGVWTENSMKGILSQHMATGESFDYSFVSVKRR